jgi:hypothetical protein
MITDCLENQFTSHDLRDETHKRRVEARVQALLEAVDDTPLEKEINKITETEKGLWNWWYTKRTPQAPSKMTTGISDTFI